MTLSLRKTPRWQNIEINNSKLVELAKNYCNTNVTEVLKWNYAIKIAMKLKDIYDNLLNKWLIQTEIKNWLKRPSISTEIEWIMTICSYNINDNNINLLIESFNTKLEKLFLENETIITEILKFNWDNNEQILLEKINKLNEKISIELFNLKLSKIN